jgi:hypothetical protein
MIKYFTYMFILISHDFFFISNYLILKRSFHDILTTENYLTLSPLAVLRRLFHENQIYVTGLQKNNIYQNIFFTLRLGKGALFVFTNEMYIYLT